MMYNMSMLHHRFSNRPGGGEGGGGGLNHLPLLFCKSVYYDQNSKQLNFEQTVLCAFIHSHAGANVSDYANQEPWWCSKNT